MILGRDQIKAYLKTSLNPLHNVLYDQGKKIFRHFTTFYFSALSCRNILKYSKTNKNPVKHPFFNIIIDIYDDSIELRLQVVMQKF